MVLTPFSDNATVWEDFPDALLAAARWRANHTGRVYPRRLADSKGWVVGVRRVIRSSWITLFLTNPDPEG